MSKWSGGEEDRVRTAVTIKEHGQTDKPLLEVVRELKDG